MNRAVFQGSVPYIRCRVIHTPSTAPPETSSGKVVRFNRAPHRSTPKSGLETFKTRLETSISRLRTPKTGIMAGAAGFEPATYGFGDRRSTS